LTANCRNIETPFGMHQSLKLDYPTKYTFSPHVLRSIFSQCIFVTHGGLWHERVHAYAWSVKTQTVFSLY